MYKKPTQQKSRDSGWLSVFDSAGRFVLSIKSECLNEIIPPGENHPGKSISEYCRHYHVERNHQGLDNEFIEPIKQPTRLNSTVIYRERLGGMLNYYYREAA